VIPEPAFLAAVLLGVFAVLSFVDGVVLHLVVERLPLREASWLEHRLHTVRALIFPILLATFIRGAGPVAIGWALLAIDQGVEFWDMAIERRSRAHSGGLPSLEYLVHGTLTTLRAATVVLVAMIDRSVADTSALDTLVALMMPGAVLVAIAHVVLASAPGRSLLARAGRAA